MNRNKGRKGSKSGRKLEERAKGLKIQKNTEIFEKNTKY